MNQEQPRHRVQPLRRLDLIRIDPNFNAGRAMIPYLCIDTRSGAMEITWERQGDSVPMDVWHGIVRRLPIPLSVDGSELTGRINHGELDLEIARAVAGTEIVWDGHNHVPRQTQDAEDALNEIQAWLDDSADAVEGGLWDAADWLQSWDCRVGSFVLTACSSDADLQAMAKALEEEACSDDVVLYGTLHALQQRREQLQAGADAG